MRPLIITDDDKRAIAEAIRMAAERPMTLAQVSAEPRFAEQKTSYTLADRTGPVAAGRNTQNVQLWKGYRVALTFEEQPLGMCKHLSISVDEPGSMPNPHAVAMICDAYGVRFPPVGRMWLEEFAKGHSAVNVVDLIGELPDEKKVLGPG